MSKYDYLFRPLEVNGVKIRNRVVMPAMNTNFADPEGHVTDQLIDYYVERAKGGVGLIITSAAVVDARSKKRPGEICIYADEFVVGLKRLAEAVQAEGARILVQLIHFGRELSSGTSTRVKGQAVGPSALPHPLTGEYCHELSGEEIAELRDLFIAASVRAKEAGLDGVEIHGAHGYLLTQFVHPFSNRRTDEYGRNTAGRIKLLVEIAKGSKEKAGSNFIICYRINGSEYLEQERLLAQDPSLTLARGLAPYVDLLHVSAGSNQTPRTTRTTIPLTSTPQGCYAYLAAQIRKHVEVPVISVGRINRPEMAETILAQGKADLVAVGRGLIADAHWAAKAQDGLEEQIRPCVACNQGCIEYLVQGKKITCLHNPTVGREQELSLRPVSQKKRVLIIGGGVAGLETARVAALRGHNVELWEKSGALGGKANLAYVTPWKDEFRGVVDYLVREVERLGVKVKRQSEGSLERIIEFNPDILVLATGSRPLSLSALSHERLFLAEEVLRDKLEELISPVCVVGGGSVGLETAAFIAAHGYETAVIEMLPEPGLDMGPINRAFWLDKLSELEVAIHVNCEVTGLDQGGLEVRFKDRPADNLGVFNSYVVAVGFQADGSLLGQLEKVKDKIGFEIKAVGDCLSPRNVLHAVREGFEVGRSL